MRILAALWFVIAALLTAHAGWAAVLPLSAEMPATRINAEVDVAPGTAPQQDVLGGRVAFAHRGLDALSGAPVNVWVRFSLPRLRPENGEFYLSIRSAERAELFATYADGGLFRQVSGNAVAVADRTTQAAVPVLVLSPARMGTRPIYVHLQYHTDYPMVMTVASSHAYFDARMLSRLVEALFLGGLLAVAIFNLYVFFALRDHPSIFLVIYVVALAVNELVTTGMGAQYLWPTVAGDPRLAVFLTTAISFISFLVFARAFLFTPIAVPWLDRALVGILAVELGLGFAQYALPVERALVLPLLASELIGMLLMFATAVVRWAQGFQPARYFTIAFVPATIGVFANLAYNAFLPRGNWFFAANGVEFGTLLEAIVISCSVLDRFRILELQRRLAQDALARESQKNVHLRRLVVTDPLTGLANRIAFSDGLQAALETARERNLLLGVLYVDLDAFKEINDAYGHRCGDEVLREVAQWLSAAVRTRDIVARIGGDEFAIILPDMPSVAHVERVVQSVRRAVERSFVYEGHRIDLGASVGFSMYPSDATTADALLDAADRAMYLEKERRRTQALPRAKS